MEVITDPRRVVKIFRLFKRLSKTPKQVFLTLVTTCGVKINEQSFGLIDYALYLNVLFEPWRDPSVY
jgi:hypothetical protein